MASASTSSNNLLSPNTSYTSLIPQLDIISLPPPQIEDKPTTYNYTNASQPPSPQKVALQRNPSFKYGAYVHEPTHFRAHADDTPEEYTRLTSYGRTSSLPNIVTAAASMAPTLNTRPEHDSNGYTQFTKLPETIQEETTTTTISSSPASWKGSHSDVAKEEGRGGETENNDDKMDWDAINSKQKEREKRRVSSPVSWRSLGLHRTRTQAQNAQTHANTHAQNSQLAGTPQLESFASHFGYHIDSPRMDSHNNARPYLGN